MSYLSLADEKLFRLLYEDVPCGNLPTSTMLKQR